MNTPLALLLALGACGNLTCLVALDPSHAVGHWRIGFLSTPHTLGIQKNLAGEIIGIQHLQHFDNNMGYLDVAAGGSFSGYVDSPVSGTMTLGTDGTGTTGIGPVFYFNENADFAVSVDSSDPGWLDLQCMVRTAAGTPPASALQGHWNIVSIDTPYQLNTDTDMGIVTNVWPLDSFGVFAGHADFDAVGNFSGVMDGAFSGTATLGPQGAVSSPAFADGEIFRLNASQDVMITFHSEGPVGGFRYFTSMVKAPASMLTHELQGSWRIVSLDTPSQLILQKNASNHVIGIQGESQFNLFQGQLTFDAQGSVTGYFDGPVAATATAGPQGTILLNSAEGSLTFYINASKDVMLSVQTEPGSPGFSEVLVLVRAVVPRVITSHLTANTMEFCWPNDGGVKFQRSTDLLGWLDVTPPTACHSEPLSTGRAFFRLVPAP